jgi:hypothetical protein
MKQFLLAAGFKGIANWRWIVMVSAVIGALFVIVAIEDRRHQNALDKASDAGAAGAIIAGQGQTLDQLKDANDAEKDLLRASERSQLRYDLCLLDSRDRAACERHKPIEGE